MQILLEWGDLRLEPNRGEVTCGNQSVALTPEETSLLMLFLQHSQQILSGGMIAIALSLEDAMLDVAAVRTHLQQLQQKLQSVKSDGKVIETVYGVGYRLKPLDEKPLQNRHAQIQAGVLAVWQRHKERIRNQVGAIAQAVEAAAQNRLSSDLRTSAIAHAHTLAGSLGSFGKPNGSAIARQIESLLQDHSTLTSTEIAMLKDWIQKLHQEIEQNTPLLNAPEQEQESNPSGLLKKTIEVNVLVVTTDSTLLSLLHTLLSPWGLRLSSASEAQSVWQTLETVAPKLLILDLEQTQLDGLTLCQSIRDHAHWNRLPIIALTTQLDAIAINHIFAAGIHDYVRKPIIEAELVTRIIYQLERYLSSHLGSQAYPSELQRIKNELERRVAERTAELVKVNQQLHAELDEHRLTQSALRASQERLSGIVEIADDAIISIDRNYTMTLFNSGAEKIFGYSASEAIGQPLDLLIPDRFAQVHRRHVSEFGHAAQATQRMDSRREIWGRRKNGEEFPAEASIAKLNAEGEIIYTVYLRDITERKQIERMKDEFVSMVSHELRTPLTSIHGSLGMLASGLLKADSDQGKRLLHIAVESTDRLVRLINDILDIERIESGRVKMEKATCDLADLIDEAIELMLPLAEKAGITLSISNVSIPVPCDRDRIIQTLTNLLSNAIKFSPRDRTVWVNVEVQTDHVLIAVKDQGRGIPADKISSIFERFQQVDSSDSRNHDGTGLGLAICQSIVQQHNGEIWVESDVGVGSTFYFTLPLPPTEIPLSCAQRNSVLTRSPNVESIAERKPLVLICNNAASIQLTLENLLERQGYRVLTVSGQQAAAAAETHHPDVILLVGDQAWETMASLKQKATTSKIPMIVCRVSPPHSDDVESSITQADEMIDEVAVFELLRQALAPVSNQMEVLIVEDDAELAEMLKILFEQHGISTIRASTGREAIRLSQQMNPDLLVLDLLLPGGDGFTVVEWLQQHSQLCHTPLVVYSVKELNRLERDRLTLGPTEFLTKGRVTIQEFEQRVMALVQRITQTTKPQ